MTHEKFVIVAQGCVSVDDDDDDLSTAAVRSSQLEAAKLPFLPIVYELGLWGVVCTYHVKRLLKK
jgi:hypothetical protein